jgi:peptidoglycan/LPS O-acetylase OafA/YrhL
MSGIFQPRVKLFAAAMSLLVVSGFTTFCDDDGRITGRIDFRVGFFCLGVLLIFFGIFRNAFLQILWGAVLAVAIPGLLICFYFGEFRGSGMLMWGVASIIAAFVGAYLLLLDPTIKDYRQTMKRQRLV